MFLPNERRRQERLASVTRPTSRRARARSRSLSAAATAASVARRRPPRAGERGTETSAALELRDPADRPHAPSPPCHAPVWRPGTPSVVNPASNTGCSTPMAVRVFVIGAGWLSDGIAKSAARKSALREQRTEGKHRVVTALHGLREIDARPESRLRPLSHAPRASAILYARARASTVSTSAPASWPPRASAASAPAARGGALAMTTTSSRNAAVVGVAARGRHGVISLPLGHT